MERINVRSLNECFGIIGDDWINVSDDSYTVIETVPSWNAGTKGLTTNSLLQKKIAKKNALKRNENYKGVNNPRAKDITVYDLKRKTNHETRTAYSLLIRNCHLFVLEIDGLLAFPDKKKKDVVTYFKNMQ